jgi:hypothetical protein
VYDFRFGSGTHRFTKHGVTVSNRATITFANSDLDDGNNLPQITIQNRTGIDFNSCYIKPSTAEDWGLNFGHLSNNSDKAITIPIPPSNYTIFDIQVRTSDPTVPGTFTKSSVSVTNDMIVTFLSTDSDGSNLNLPVIVIQNNTTQYFNYAWLKPSTSTDWGSDFGGYIPIGESRAISLPHPLSTHNVYDFRFGSGTHRFTKHGVTVSNGTTITFANSDLE